MYVMFSPSYPSGGPQARVMVCSVRSITWTLLGGGGGTANIFVCMCVCNSVCVHVCVCA